MLCLTVRQPWAYAIFNGKDIENRDWKIPTTMWTYLRHANNWVAIHSASGMTMAEWKAARDYCQERGVSIPVPELLLRGHVLGKVRITGCVETSPSPWFMGRYGFVLENAVRFDIPKPAKGALGFWEWTGEAR